MATKADFKAMEEFLPVILGTESSLVTVMEPTNGSVLHISSNGKIKEFIPMVSNRTLSKEDRRVPRICSAESLWGCFLGYAATVDEFYNLSPGDWKGGYYIYSLPCDLIVQPTKQLLPDVKKTDETWIIGHDEKHQSVKPTIVGKCFFYSVTYKRTQASPIYDIVIYIQITEPTPIMDKAILMEPGYYKLTVMGISDAVFWLVKNSTLVSIDATEFKEAKKLTASTLSFEMAPSSQW